MENTENTVAFVQTEGDMNNQPESTLTTNTEEVKEKVEKKSAILEAKNKKNQPKGKLSQNEIKIMALEKAYGEQYDTIRELIQYLHQLENQLATTKIRETACLLEIMDKLYNDCPKVKEDSITKEDAKNYISVLGLYHKEITSKQIVKLVPLEEGWKMMTIVPNDPEKPTSFTANYEFKGVLPDANYPTSWTVTGENPNSFTMKLREYLKSLKGEIIMSSSGTTGS